MKFALPYLDASGWKLRYSTKKLWASVAFILHDQTFRPDLNSEAQPLPSFGSLHGSITGGLITQLQT